MSENELETNVDEIQMIVFKLGGEEYALPITFIQEIIMLQISTRIPKSPDYIKGVINLRGNIIPIIDGRKRFNLGNDYQYNENDSRIMVLKVESEIVGLIVDSVAEVVHLKTAEIESLPVEMEDDAAFLCGIGKFDGRLLILIDPERFLTIGDSVNGKKLTKITEMVKNIKEINDVKELMAESASK